MTSRATAMKYVSPKMKRNKKDISILGPNITGLIFRYALVFIEKNSISHNTRLWVSLDGPRQGKNIPIVDQYFISYFIDAINKASIKEALTIKLILLSSQANVDQLLLM